MDMDTGKGIIFTISKISSFSNFENNTSLLENKKYISYKARSKIYPIASPLNPQIYLPLRMHFPCIFKYVCEFIILPLNGIKLHIMFYNMPFLFNIGFFNVYRIVSIFTCV